MLRHLEHLRDQVVRALEHNAQAAAELAHLATSRIPRAPCKSPNGKCHTRDPVPAYLWDGQHWRRQPLGDGE